MSGQWRVTVDSWITDEAQWYGTRTYVISGDNVHSLDAALQAIIDGDVRDKLGSHRFTTHNGPPPDADYPAPPEVVEAGDSD